MRASFDNSIPYGDVKSQIVSRTIAQDQHAVAEQWAKTFATNDNDDTATNIARLMLACVAKGDFFIKNAVPGNISAGAEFAAKSFERPSDKLNAVDYISHASRIIIDYSALSEPQKNALLIAFAGKGVYMRPSTHAVRRLGDGVREDKLNLPNAGIDAMKTTTVNIVNRVANVIGYDVQAEQYIAANHRGVNIAMGGENNNNYYGTAITCDGSSGHIYFYANEADKLILCGLEQTAPNAHADQFGQGHSYAGGSDVYTAAGSLYFSDPIYHAKLVKEYGILPPAKYNGMLVKLTDENWFAALDFMTNLRAGTDVAQLTQTLMQTKPKTCERNSHSNQSFIDFDIKNYWQRIFAMFIENNQLCAANMDIIKEIHAKLMDLTVNVVYPDNKTIAALRKAKSDLQSFVKTNNFGAKNYLSAIDTVIHIFEMERVRVNRQGVTADMAKHHSQMNRIADIEVELVSLYHRIPEILAFYQNSIIDPTDSVVAQYIVDLQKLSQTIFDNCAQLHSETDADNDFAMLNSITIDNKLIASLPQFEALLIEGNRLLNRFPRLVSGEVSQQVLEMRANLENLQAELDKAQTARNAAAESAEKFKNAIKDLVDENNLTKQSRQELASQLQKEKTLSAKLAETLKIQEEQIDELRANLENAEKDLAASTQQFDKLNDDYAKLIRELQALNELSSDSEGNEELVQLRQQLTNIRKELEVLRAKIDADAEKIVGLASKNTILTSDDETSSEEEGVLRMNRLDETTALQTAITQLDARAAELRKKGNIAAANEASDLVMKLQDGLSAYLTNKNDDATAKQQFQSTYNEIFSEPLTNLYNDPKSRIFVKNVLLACFTFGIGLIAMAINKGVTGNYGFFTEKSIIGGGERCKTFSIINETRKIDKAVNRIAPAIAVDEEQTRKRLRITR